MSEFIKSLAEELNETMFLEQFLDVFVRNGFGALPKREIELVLLQLIKTNAESWNEGPLPIYQLARNLKLSPKRLQNLFDELDYRDESKSEEWCDNQLKSILEHAEKIRDGEYIQFQIDDGLLRDYATAKVRAGYGIVDTSFNSAVIKLTGKRFVALAFELLDENTRNEMLEQIPIADRNAEQDAQNTKGSIRLFIDAFMVKAGETAGKKSVDLGFAILTGGLSVVTDIVSNLVETDS